MHKLKKRQLKQKTKNYETIDFRIYRKTNIKES